MTIKPVLLLATGLAGVLVASLGCASKPAIIGKWHASPESMAIVDRARIPNFDAGNTFVEFMDDGAARCFGQPARYRIVGKDEVWVYSKSVFMDLLHSADIVWKDGEEFVARFRLVEKNRLNLVDNGNKVIFTFAR